ncbi:MAG: DUF3857 domain-containing protein [Croceibacterium sp.]
MRYIAAAASGIALVWVSPAYAGEEPLYQPAPGWVQVAQLPAASSGPPLVLLDEQRRLDGNRLWSYSDRAFRIDNPQVLQSAGTIQAKWLPDKGDLIIHRVAIIRGGEEINVLDGGAKFDVLRREAQLERRTIDGALTATLSVPGLRVGDILRLTYTVSQADQALENRVQTVVPLVAKPVDVGFARVIVSWPQDQNVKWQLVNASGDMPAPVLSDGFETLSLALPLAKPADMPSDAPSRYRLPPMLQAGTFSGWEDVSSTMAPLFATDGLIEPGGPIAHQVDLIKAAHSSPSDRALAALQLVQDQVSYLANGLDGGNYIPQTPADTWQKRYGDCKAKTLLLLSILRAMDIEAEPLVVQAAGGDAVPALLPLPSDFNHIIVHAIIDGTDYWLDGTNTGSSKAVFADVPDFAYGLPLRTNGADLLPLTQRPRDGFDASLALHIDESAGIDLPALFNAEWTLSGPSGGMVRAVSGQATEQQLKDFVDSFVSDSIGNHWLIDSSVTYDAQSNLATVKASGMLPSGWEFDHGLATSSVSLPSTAFQFRPDRSRSQWRSIPVALPGPFSTRTALSLTLPDASEPYKLDGHTDINEDIANVRLRRHAELAGRQLTVLDSVGWPGGEAAPDAAAAAKTQAARLGSVEMTLRAPANTARRFRFASGANRADLRPIEQAYTRLIAADTTDINRVMDRARFRSSTFDRAGAIADFDRVIAEQPSADAYQWRAELQFDTGHLDKALADAQAASELEPGLSNAAYVANLMAYAGNAEDAFTYLADQGGSAEEQRQVAGQLSDLDALAGRPEDGLARLDDLLQQRPGDAAMLNANCYYRATWKMGMDGMAEVCNQAVERSDSSPSVLDSRAMGYYRLGDYERALRDVNAALTSNPDQTPSLFLRGVIRREMGDAGGQADIREALQRKPSLEQFYERFGITGK